MTPRLTTDAAFAEGLGITLDKLHDLRRKNNWPCVRLGRFDIRFTDAQMEQIIALQTEQPKKKAAAPKAQAAGAIPGQTAKSAARRSA